MASGTIDVYVKIPTGRNAQYYVRLSDTIETVCQKVAKEEKVKETQVRLKYQGKILDRNHSMSYLGVRPETILKAEILVPRPVTLLVALPNDLGETEVTSTSLETVTDVVSQIADVIKEDKSRLVLKYDGRQVRGTTLMDAGLVDGSAVQIEIVEPKSSATKTSEGTGASPEASTLKEEDKQAILSSFDTGGRRVEVVFSFDTTGSMYSCLDQVRTKLSESCTRLIQDIPNIRIGIMAHGDYGDQSTSYVIRSLDLTSDVQSLVDFVTKVPRTGGDDTAECYEWVLRKAQGLDWSEDSAKALVVIGDAYPHPPGFTTAQVFWKDELSLLTGMEIKVYGVRALHISQSEAFYKELSDVSGGHYLTMTNFDVITDMFLAVCYREANQVDLGQFEREVEEAGRMTEERRQIFKSLQNQKQQENSSSAGASREQTVPVAEGRPRRQVTADWWEPTLYQGKPQFKYDPQTDKFSRYREIATGLPTESRPTAARCKSKKKCSVM